MIGSSGPSFPAGPPGRSPGSYAGLSYAGLSYAGRLTSEHPGKGRAGGAPSALRTAL
ncbi:MAG TPA: hypothetical protein VE465_07230 [Streptosporangiaceae bacterium]|jgi:hypothetical protein|nr:hypothetical protein [Streptosporangiaceae bacterium]